MPRLRQSTAKKDELFDSTKVEKPVEEQTTNEPQLEAVADEPEVVVEEPKKKEPEQDDAALALKKQVDALRFSEQARFQAEHDRQEANKRAKEYQDSLIKSKRDIIEQQEATVDSSLTAAKMESEKAVLEIENAESLGDVRAKAEANLRLIKAQVNISILERGKEELKEQRREFKKERKRLEEQAAQPQQQQQPQPQQQRAVTQADVDNYILSDDEKRWLKGRIEYLNDPEKSANLRWANERAHRMGYKSGDKGFLPEIESGLSIVEGGAQDERRASVPVSAPVSRDVPSSGSGYRQQGRITLTRDQLDAAKVAGVTPAEYARQLAKLNEMKANGDYGDRR